MKSCARGARGGREARRGCAATRGGGKGRHVKSCAGGGARGGGGGGAGGWARLCRVEGGREGPPHEELRAGSARREGGSARLCRDEGGREGPPLIDKLQGIFGAGNLYLAVSRHFDEAEERFTRDTVEIAGARRLPL